MSLLKMFFVAAGFLGGLYVGQGLPHLFPELLGVFGPVLFAIGWGLACFDFLSEGAGSPLLMGMGFVGFVGMIEPELPWFAYWILWVIFIFIVYKFRD
jgi:hypothetical protein